MVEKELNLTEEESSVLREISRRTGRAESDLIREAVGRLINGFQNENRLTLMQRAGGIWKDRSDSLMFGDGQRTVAEGLDG